MSEIQFDVENQKVIQKTKHFLVNKSNKYIELVFNCLTEEWRNLPKYIIFHAGSKDYLYPLGTTCEVSIAVPEHAIRNNNLKFSFYGENATEEYRVTTQKMTLILHESGYTNETDTFNEEVEVDVFVLLTERINNSVSKITCNDGKLYCYNDGDSLLDVIDIGYSETEINEMLSAKADHEEIPYEIRRSLRCLANSIRNYDGE